MMDLLMIGLMYVGYPWITGAAVLRSKQRYGNEMDIFICLFGVVIELMAAGTFVGMLLGKGWAAFVVLLVLYTVGFGLCLRYSDALDI